MKFKTLPVILFCLLSHVISARLFAQENANSWPQWRGPGRDGICKETGLLKTWPEGGPALLWKITGLGKGYSSPSIAGDRIVTMGDRGDGQFVIALDRTSRKEVWAVRICGNWDDGSRGTPTIDGDKVYALGAHGDLVCLNLADGKEVWHKNMAADFGGQMMSGWGFSESPLIDGAKLLCTPGGKEKTVVALDKNTGDLIWACAVPPLGSRGKDGAGYSSMVAADINGVRQYIQLLGTGLVGIDAETGTFLWGYNPIANNVANIATPIVQDNLIFCSTAYGTGSSLVKITNSENQWKAEEVYFLDSNTYQNHHGGLVLVDGFLYGGHGQNAGAPTCIEMATGKILWKEKALDKGSAAVLYADGNLYFLYEAGTLALLRADPQKFTVSGSFAIPEESGPKWAHPVILDKQLYIRVHDVLFCYDIGQKG